MCLKNFHFDIRYAYAQCFVYDLAKRFSKTCLNKFTYPIYQIFMN